MRKLSWSPTPLVAAVTVALWGCAGVDVRQGRVHSDAEVANHLRGQAAGELACPREQLLVKPEGPLRYAVTGCARQATYCCHAHLLEIDCEGEPHADKPGGQCHDPALEPPPELPPRMAYDHAYPNEYAVQRRLRWEQVRKRHYR